MAELSGIDNVFHDVRSALLYRVTSIHHKASFLQKVITSSHSLNLTLFMVASEKSKENLYNVLNILY